MSNETRLDFTAPNRGRLISREDAERQFSFAIGVVGILAGIALASALMGYSGQRPDSPIKIAHAAVAPGR